MKKKKPEFSLSIKGQAKLNKTLRAITRGITVICEMHKRDKNPSIKQADFEEMYIERLFSPIAAAVNASVKAMTDGLTAQRQAEAEALSAENKNQEQKKENRE